MKRLGFQTYLAAVLSASTIAWAEEPERDIAAQIAEAFQFARASLGHENNAPPIPKKLLKEYPNEVLEGLKPYEHDPVPRIRLTACMFVWNIGVSSGDPEIRQEAVWRLANACKDPDSGVRRCASGRLLSFEREDFTPPSKAILLEALKLYERDSVPSIRLDACMFVWNIGVSSGDPGIRQEAVWRLVNACKDPDSGVWQYAAGRLHSGVWQYAAQRLLSFEEDDFTPASKAILHDLLMDDRREFRTSEIIWVIGVAGMKEELPRLESFLLDVNDPRLKEGPHVGSASWHARLAMGRLGVEEQVHLAIELVEREKSYRRVSLLLKHLAYTRHPAAFAHIATYLDSDERLPRTKETVPGELYSHRAMSILVEAVPGFPIKRTGAPYTQAQIDQAREWMKHHSWETKD